MHGSLSWTRISFPKANRWRGSLVSGITESILAQLLWLYAEFLDLSDIKRQDRRSRALTSIPPVGAERHRLWVRVCPAQGNFQHGIAAAGLGNQLVVLTDPGFGV